MEREQTAAAAAIVVTAGTPAYTHIYLSIPIDPLLNTNIYPLPYLSLNSTSFICFAFSLLLPPSGGGAHSYVSCPGRVIRNRHGSQYKNTTRI